MTKKKYQSQSDSDAIELFLTLTGNFLKYAAVIILSVLENTSRRINISILCSEVSDEDKERMSTMV